MGAAGRRPLPDGAMIHQVHEHVGVRAQGMILTGALWFLIGLGLLLGMEPSPVQQAWHQFIPESVSIFLWMGLGPIAAGMSLNARMSDWGLGLLIIAPAIRFFSYSWAWVAYLLGVTDGDPSGWYSASLWLVRIFWVILLSHIDPAAKYMPLTGPRHRR